MKKSIEIITKKKTYGYLWLLKHAHGASFNFIKSVKHVSSIRLKYLSFVYLEKDNIFLLVNF